MITKPNMVDKYWSSDHHRFEWTNFMQKLDPMSWHALAISHPDSFLKGTFHQVYHSLFHMFISLISTSVVISLS